MPSATALARILAAVLSTAIAAPAMAASAPRVQIASGTLQGRIEDGVASFKGIPYAAAPVGALRWRAPQPAAAWTGVRAATAYAPDCMQDPFPSDAAPLGTRPDEDCLYANVWAPARAQGTLPVLVWIYGGGFVNGGASPPTYAGAELARQGVLVFSFNYRVGRFGTFAHPQLSAANADQGRLGNYGFMDQIAALEWVRRNIAAFGGDPDNVTVVGESAGGMSIHVLLTSPLARGLFQRAVIMSGGDGGNSGTLAQAEQTGLLFAHGQGIAGQDPDALAKLRALPAAAVTDGLNLTALFAPAPGPRTFSSPFIDGTVAVDSAAAYAQGRSMQVPVMIGATSDDIGGAQGYMVTGAAKMARLFSAHAPVYAYRFGYVATSARGPDSHGASHASDIPFFFHTEAIKYGQATSAQDRQAGRSASAYLVNFVKHGDPNGPGLPHWAPMGVDAPAMQVLGEDAHWSPAHE